MGSSINESVDPVEEMQMRARIIAFLDGDAEAVEGLFAEEIVFAIMAAFDAVYQFIDSKPN